MLHYVTQKYKLCLFITLYCYYYYYSHKMCIVYEIITLFCSFSEKEKKLPLRPKDIIELFVFPLKSIINAYIAV